MYTELLLFLLGQLGTSLKDIIKKRKSREEQEKIKKASILAKKLEEKKTIDDLIEKANTIGFKITIKQNRNYQDKLLNLFKNQNFKKDIIDYLFLLDSNIQTVKLDSIIKTCDEAQCGLGKVVKILLETVYKQIIEDNTLSNLLLREDHKTIANKIDEVPQIIINDLEKKVAKTQFGEKLDSIKKLLDDGMIITARNEAFKLLKLTKNGTNESMSRY